MKVSKDVSMCRHYPSKRSLYMRLPVTSEADE
jgi:hypothetical protein